jgi:endonuclease/exonuclease/phosphatase family metal-dependent hydrolase
VAKSAIKLVTYNIRYSLGRDGRYNLPRIAEAIGAADIIALQEVERGWPRTGMVDQPQTIGRLLPDFYWVYGPAFDMDASQKDESGRVVNGRRQFGTMLLSRWPILSSRLHIFPKFESINQFNMDLGALEGIVATPGEPLRLYSLHLNHNSSRERLMQLQTLRQIHQQAPTGGGAWCGPSNLDGDDWSAGGRPPPMPREAILLGDFNATPDSPEYEFLVGPWQPHMGRIYHADSFVDSWTVIHGEEVPCITWRADPHLPTYERRLDYCFVSGRLAQYVQRAWVDLEAEGSDHCPYWVEMEI